MNTVRHRVRRSRVYLAVAKVSKGITLPGFYGATLYDVFSVFRIQLRNSSLTRRAKSIAFDFAMAVPAVMICILTIIPYLPISHQFTKELLRLTRYFTPTQKAYNMVNAFLHDFLHTPRVGLLSFGFILVIFYASNAMMGIISTFDLAIYKQRRTSNFLKRRVKAIRLTVIVLMLLIGTILLSIGQGWLLGKIMKWLHLKGSDIFWVSLVKWTLSIGLFFYAVAFIYKYAPSVKKRWPLISPGSIVATVLIMLTTYGFSSWVNHFNNFNKIYGSLGTIMIMMLLIYLNSLILLIGFEINLSISLIKNRD